MDLLSEWARGLPTGRGTSAAASGERRGAGSGREGSGPGGILRADTACGGCDSVCGGDDVEPGEGGNDFGAGGFEVDRVAEGGVSDAVVQSLAAGNDSQDPELAGAAGGGRDHSDGDHAADRQSAGCDGAV